MMEIHLKILSEDFVQAATWLNDPEICRFNNHDKMPHSKESASSYIRSMNASHKDILWGIFAGIAHIGNITLQNIDWLNRNAEIAIVIDAAYQRKKAGRQAVKLVVDHAFRKLGLHKVYMGASQANIPMQRIALALDFHEEGLLIDHLYKNGEFMNIIRYGKVRED